MVAVRVTCMAPSLTRRLLLTVIVGASKNTNSVYDVNTLVPVHCFHFLLHLLFIHSRIRSWVMFYA